MCSLQDRSFLAWQLLLWAPVSQANCEVVLSPVDTKELTFNPHTLDSMFGDSLCLANFRSHAFASFALSSLFTFFLLMQDWRPTPKAR